MDFLSALHISASGLAAERTRVDIATSNLANAESTRGPDGGPYRRRDPVMESVAFESELSGAHSVAVTQVVEDQGPGRAVYMPSHPDADPRGFVTLPNVDPVQETVNLISASRGYDANASAFETVKVMATKALDIMR